MLTSQPLAQHVREVVAIALQEVIAGAAEAIPEALHNLLHLLWGSAGFPHCDTLPEDHWMQAARLRGLNPLQHTVQEREAGSHLAQEHLWDWWQKPQICLSHDL